MLLLRRDSFSATDLGHITSTLKAFSNFKVSGGGLRGAAACVRPAGLHDEASRRTTIGLGGHPAV